MAEDKSTQSQESPADAELNAGIPMKRASPVSWIAGGVGVLVLGGLVVASMSGGEKAQNEPAKAEKSAAEEPKLSAKEAREHLVKTQKALAAAEEEVAAQKAQAEAEAEAAQQQAEPEAPAPVAKSAAAGAPEKTTTPQQSKKKIESLDSLGADITSALK